MGKIDDKIYALYKGEDILITGTIKQIAEYRNIKEKSVRFMLYPAYKNSRGDSKKALALVLLDEEMDQQAEYFPKQVEKEPVTKKDLPKVFLSKNDFTILKTENTYSNILIVEYQSEVRVIDKMTFELMPKTGLKVNHHTY